MTAQMNRRDGLKGLLHGAIIGTTLGAFYLAGGNDCPKPSLSVDPLSGETPVMRAYRAYVAHREWINTTDLSEEEMDAATAKIDDLLNAITSAPSAGPADTAIKFYAVTVDYEALYDNPHREALEAEARALIAA